MMDWCVVICLTWYWVLRLLFTRRCISGRDRAVISHCFMRWGKLWFIVGLTDCMQFSTLTLSFVVLCCSWGLITEGAFSLFYHVVRSHRDCSHLTPRWLAQTSDSYLSLCRTVSDGSNLPIRYSIYVRYRTALFIGGVSKR